MDIVKKLIKYNFTPNKNTPKFIIIHDTGNFSNGANAEMHYRYFNSGSRNASAHLFIDDENILQLIEFKDKAWHCGNNGNKYGVDNHNSIGVEICINGDGNYTKTIQNTIEVVVFLMKKFSIPIENVLRHYDCSQKNCPQTMNNGDWGKWIKFKETIWSEFNKEDSNMPKWKVEILKELHELGIVQDYDGWLPKLNEPIQVWTVFALILNLYKKLKKG